MSFYIMSKKTTHNESSILESRVFEDAVY
jgi:hypothetical protein